MKKKNVIKACGLAGIIASVAMSSIIVSAAPDSSYKGNIDVMDRTFDTDAGANNGSTIIGSSNVADSYSEAPEGEAIAVVENNLNETEEELTANEIAALNNSHTGSVVSNGSKKKNFYKQESHKEKAIDTKSGTYIDASLVQTHSYGSGIVLQDDTDDLYNLNYDSIKPNMSQKEFIESIGMAAVSYWDDYGYLPSVTIAQAILESGWGRSSLARNYNNYFGIKYNTNIEGGYVYMETKEQSSSGKYYTITAKFMAWDTLEEGIKGRFDFLKNNPRYSNLKGVTDYREECRLLKKDGYATSINYAQNLIKLIQQYNLDKYDEIIAQ